MLVVRQLVNLPSNCHQCFLCTLSSFSPNHCTYCECFCPSIRGPALHEPPLKRLKEGRESGSSHRPKTSARDSKTTSQDRSYPDHQHHSEETCRDGGRKEGGNDSRQLPREQSWLYPHLRVRMVDQRYGRGRYYNTKVFR